LVKEKKPDRESEPNWELPGGFADVIAGERSVGESLETALQREIEEELGPQNARALMRNLSYLTSRGDTYRDGTPIVVAYYVTEARRQELSPSQNASVDLGWFEIDDLPTFEYSSDRDAIDYFKERF
jgi:ADP-ribose pyrophosphatase YjhB (NUDIX family)